MNDVLQRIHQSADEVSSGSEQVSGSARELSQGAVEKLAATIAQSLERVQRNAESAVDGSRRMEALGKEIEHSNEQMAQIAGVIQVNSATAQESAAASEQLSGQARMLKEMVSRFRLCD